MEASTTDSLSAESPDSTVASSETEDHQNSNRDQPNVACQQKLRSQLKEPFAQLSEETDGTECDADTLQTLDSIKKSHLDRMLNLERGDPSPQEQKRSVSPAPSDISMKSDKSNDRDLDFRRQEPCPLQHTRPVSPVPSDVPITRDLSQVKDDPPDFLSELSSHSLKTEQSEDSHKSKGDKDVKRNLQANPKKICRQDRNILKGHDPETDIYEIQADKKEVKVKSYTALFLDSDAKKVRTVLMTGVPNVGKTFQTRRFMSDWANKTFMIQIDFLLPLDFTELNSRRAKVQSMNDLLCHSLDDKENEGLLNYKDSKLFFILDGLEKCQLPLDFNKNKVLTDMEEKASLDVLLTNLIQGNLLPSAHLWIISQPSGVHKVPAEHVQKVTECRENATRRQQLRSALKQRFLWETNQEEDRNHPSQAETEHIFKEDEGAEVRKETNGIIVKKKTTQVKALSDIFKGTKDKTEVRTVMTFGEGGIEKSFYVRKFIREWISDSGKVKFGPDKGYQALFPLNVSELNLIKEKTSLLGLLHHFFKETKDHVISKYEQLKVLFILDGLDAYQSPLGDEDLLTDVREPATVNVLLTNLIRGDLLPSARLWITSKPTAANVGWVDIYIHRKTEIRYKPDIASQKKLKSQLKRQFSHVCEGIDQQGTAVLLNNIYTDVYIIEGERGEVNQQHETKQVQNAKFKQVTPETSIKCHDIFKPQPEDRKIGTVLTMGVAGIGKSFTTMKYMLDWAEDKANKDILFVFPFSFRELNLIKEKSYSLEELIREFFPAMETSEISDVDSNKILIVLDGFDECRLDLDFNECNSFTNVKERTSVSDLLTNLIEGNLLSKAKIWITSRPAASSRIPPSHVDRVTEVRGFNDEQKEMYFRKRFTDKDLREKILSHVKNSRSLFIMCHIPVFCWITSKVLEHSMKTNQEEKMPKTLTDMYIHFLLLQCKQANVKYASEGAETDLCLHPESKKTVLALGKLALEGLEEGDLLFTEDHLIDSGINITQAAVFSGLFTQIKREGHGGCQKKLFCFVHLSLQEFMAALYAFYSFTSKGENLLTKPASTAADLPALNFYKTAVDKALDNENGDWDLFLRFLLGLSLDINQDLLQDLLEKKESSKKTNKETIEYIKNKIREDNSDADKNGNLFYCLNELKDHSLVEEVKKYLHSKTGQFENWSAVSFVLLTSHEKLEVFNLKEFVKSDKALRGLLPVVRVSKTALLSLCELTEASCVGLASFVLNSPSNNVKELDLRHNDLLDSGVEELSKGLKSLHCKLETLKLTGCQVTEKGCLSLASALESNKSLKQLDLSYNHPGVNGKMKLLALEKDPKTSLEKVCLDNDGEHRLKQGLKKYGADLTFDENTASKRLVLSEGNRRVKTFKKVEEKTSRPVHKDTFRRSQVLCEQSQQGFSYWEVEWRGKVGIAVAYRGVGRDWSRKGGLGSNKWSWSLICSDKGYLAMHDESCQALPDPKTCENLPIYNKIAVFLDWEGGTLTYYGVESGELHVIHTFEATFKEPLIPCFWFQRGSVTLCQID